MSKALQFREAAQSGNIPQLEKLWKSSSPKEQQVILKFFDNGYDSFNAAADNGHIEVMDRLWRWAAAFDGLQQEMLKAKDYHTLYPAAMFGRVDMMKRLWEWASEQAKQNILSQPNLTERILTRIAQNKGYKLLIDICAHMRPESCAQAKAALIQVPSIRLPADFDQQVGQKRAYYATMRHILKEAGISDNIANNQVFVALKQTAKIIEADLFSTIGFNTDGDIVLLPIIWPSACTVVQIGAVADILRSRNSAAKAQAPRRDKDDVKKSPRAELAAIEINPRADISVARQICEQLYHPRSRNIGENIWVTTLQVRLKASTRVQELARQPEALEQFIKILRAQLEASRVNYKTKESVIDLIITATLASCADTRVTFAALPPSPANSWVKRVESSAEAEPKKPGSKRKASEECEARVEKKALVRDPNAAGLGL